MMLFTTHPAQPEAHVCQTWAHDAVRARNAQRRPHTRRTRNAGFSLMEVLVALGIFTVGLVAVAAIFPTAITIQRDTVRQVDGERIGKNARAMVLAMARNDSASYPDQPYAEMSYDPSNGSGSLSRFISNAKIASAYNPTPVLPMIDLPEAYMDPDNYLHTNALHSDHGRSPVTLDAPSSFHGLFNIEMRSYPKNNPEYLRRDYYWYPLLKVSDATSPNPKFTMIVIVMHRSGTDLPPEIRRSEEVSVVKDPLTGRLNTLDFGTDLLPGYSNDMNNNFIPDYISPGDQIICDDGNIHTVVKADANSVTVDSPNVGNPKHFYFAVAIDRANLIKKESLSPIVWIEDDITLSVNP